MTTPPPLNDEHDAPDEHETDIGPVLGMGTWQDDTVYTAWLHRQQAAVAVDRLRRGERILTPSSDIPDLLQIHLPDTVHRDAA